MVQDPAAAAAATPVPGSAVLAPEEVLLLYSDGLIEKPSRTLDAGLADLEIVAGMRRRTRR